jgi:hypothetical protein
MFSAAMPKATVNEDNDSLLLKNKIGVAKQREMPPPTFDSILAEKLRETNFGFPVSLPANRRHYFGTLTL